jgi:predicted nucleotidyltransferase
MDRGKAIAKLKQHEAELKRLGVEHLYLFGSTARRVKTRILTSSLSS